MASLLWLIIVGLGLLYWWKSGQFKGRARTLAIDYCKQHNLQLLDDSMVSSGLWPEKIAGRGLHIRRTYQFEFTSTGAQRYQGTIILAGMQLKAIKLDPYKLPDSD